MHPPFLFDYANIIRGEYMYNNFLLGPLAGLGAIGISVLLLWSTVWKGLSLWKAARNNQRYWFVALLIVNSLGILSIIYIAFFQKKRK